MTHLHVTPRGVWRGTRLVLPPLATLCGADFKLFMTVPGARCVGFMAPSAEPTGRGKICGSRER